MGIVGLVPLGLLLQSERMSLVLFSESVRLGGGVLRIFGVWRSWLIGGLARGGVVLLG